MTDPWLWGDSAEIAWGDGDTMLSSADSSSSQSQAAPSAAAQSSGGYAARVRAKWDEIEAREELRAKEEAERENIRKQQEAKRQLAELEAKKRQTRTIAERRRKLEARIEAYQAEIAELRSAMVELLDEIERLRVEAELQQTIALRRRRLLLAIATAA